ncbi:MAG: inositol monophosphatase [Planctomycetes bacterium]|nr:inositol monophosphatase [Planctomycetota bacterium]
MAEAGGLDRCRDAAVRAAQEAGRCILAWRGRLGPGALGFKGVRDLVTAADLEAEELIVQAIGKQFPEHAVLAEETSSGAAARASRGPLAQVDASLRPAASPTDLGPLRQRMSASRFCWIVDPLDGTTNFAHGHPFFSVSIALYEEGRPALGVVFAPVLDELFVAVRGAGATLNGRPIGVSGATTLTDAIFATGFPYRRDQLSNLENNVEHFNRFILEVRGFRRCGSAAIDLAYVAAGRYSFFFEAQLEPWDVAAGALLVQEAGGQVSDYAGGEDWLFGRRILASNGALHALALARLAGA